MVRYALLPALAATLAVAGCGSSGKSTLNGAASQAGVGVQLADCIRAHGVPNFPDPTASDGGGVQIQASRSSGSGQSMTVNGVSVNAPAFQSAMRACQRYMPRGGGKLPPGGIATIRKTALKFAACMRSNGVPNFPDPQVQTGPNGGVGVRIGGPGSGLNPQSPAFQRAQRQCRPLMGLLGGPKGAPPGATGVGG
jgi:hypothetical protein